MRGAAEPGAVRLERLLPAPVEDVFAAWTDPAQMGRWLAPVGHAEVEADAVVGGRLRVVMTDGDVRIEHDGEYLEVQPPERLSFTWRSRYTGEEPSVVTVELHDEGGSTRLVLHHDRLPPEVRASHEGGWAGILDRLVVVVSPGAAEEARDREEDEVSVDVRTEIEIDRPRDEVATYTIDPSNATEWYRNIRSVEWETPPPLVVGSRLRFRARFVGRDLAYTYEIRELVSGARLVMGTTDGPLGMETTYTFDDAPGGGTRVGLRNRGGPTGFAKVLSSVMAKAIRRENTKDLALLKEILESR